jgi:type I restriction enzyme S subunit
VRFWDSGPRSHFAPVDEQHRIVAKVDELMALCKELDSELATTATARRRLLESTLAEALGERTPQCAKQAGGSHHREHRQHRGRPGRGHAPPLSVPLSSAVSQTLAKNIPEAILAHVRPGRAYSRSEITGALSISDADWTWAIRQLKEAGRVRQSGERRGARYELNLRTD